MSDVEGRDMNRVEVRVGMRFTRDIGKSIFIVEVIRGNTVYLTCGRSQVVTGIDLMQNSAHWQVVA